MKYTLKLYWYNLYNSYNSGYSGIQTVYHEILEKIRLILFILRFLM